MSGGKKVSPRGYGFGALRSATPVNAPRLEFTARGRESKADLRQYCAPVEDQAELGSCNACAVVSALEFLQKKSGAAHTDLSVLYVYYYGRRLAGNEDKHTGLLCHHATAAVMAYGVCPEALWPYRTDKFTQEPPERARKEAGRFDAVQYARLGSSDEAKLSLASGIPVLFGLDIPSEYYHSTGSDGRMAPLGTYDHMPMTGHTMMVVGYDDQSKTWLAQNSWGAQWGERGYVHMPYDVVSKYAWNDELWAIGALEKVGRAKLVGPSVAKTVADTQQNAVNQVNEAMAKLGKEIRQDLDKRVDHAKLSIRERLEAQERELEEKRKHDNGG